MNLTQLVALFDRQHTPVNGCDLRAEEAAITARETFGPGAFCLVREWSILDLEVSVDQLNMLHTRGLKPVLVYALCVVLDSRGRYQPGDWVCTSFQTGYESPGFFLTKNTAYVLLGKGKRQAINVDDLNALMGQ